MQHVNTRLDEEDVDPLQHIEFVCARLYTGPCFVKYNAVLRGLGVGEGEPLHDAFERLCLRNTYSTTIACCNSAIVKLGKLTRVCKVYRGISGRKLPSEFFEPNEFDARGAVEFAFTSTTAERDVALSYAAGSSGSAILLEMQMGMVDRGADIGWLSQYPHEAEILFNPLTSFEVLQTRVEGRVICVQ
eukprot:7388186-Prymnesium_polylepis.1